jgi:hypothetical protein
MTRYRRATVKISRVQMIGKLVRKKYKAKRPTAEQIKEIIDAHGLNVYTTDGKRRSREVISKNMAKALNTLT